MLRGVGKFVGAGDGLDDDVFVFHAGCFERFEGALEEGVDDFCVPAGVEDADSEGVAC